jgi:hypothetical protein
VHFIDDVNFVTRLYRSKFDKLAKFSDFVNTPVGSSVNFVNINGNAIRNLTAICTDIARRWGGACFAIQGLGQNAGYGCFSYASRAAEDEGMCNAVL